MRSHERGWFELDRSVMEIRDLMQCLAEYILIVEVLWNINKLTFGEKSKFRKHKSGTCHKFKNCIIDHQRHNFWKCSSSCRFSFFNRKTDRAGWASKHSSELSEYFERQHQWHTYKIIWLDLELYLHCWDYVTFGPIFNARIFQLCQLRTRYNALI